MMCVGKVQPSCSASSIPIVFFPSMRYGSRSVETSKYPDSAANARAMLTSRGSRAGGRGAPPAAGAGQAAGRGRAGGRGGRAACRCGGGGPLAARKQQAGGAGGGGPGCGRNREQAPRELQQSV